MAIIVDPDNLDRHQIIFGTENQSISIRDVGSLVHANLNDVTDGYTNATTFESASSTFQTNGVAAGDIICIFTGLDAGHYVVDSVDSETSITVETNSDFTSFTGDSDAVFDIRDPSGGSVVDGVTEQAVYSFAKEEWKTDTRAVTLSDDLIQHPFPFEPITREQMEIGGGVTHEDWTWFDTTTRKTIRTGGWADKNTASTDLEQWAGIITLGSVDSDSQVYYQQIGPQNNPTSFTFMGAVNEPILINENGGNDYRDYLKLFVRKKQRTYAQAEISDIGVTQLETIVNRFPLSHAIDTAITDTDGEILGSTPFRNQGSALESGTDGDKTSTQFTFSSATATFQSNGVVAGDALVISSGTEQGVYTIQSVDSETQITIAQDFEFTSAGWGSTESSLTYSVTSTHIIANQSSPRTDGVLANVDGDTGTLTSATGGFSGVVAANDILVITESSSEYMGVYKVISVDSDTQLTINTSDQVFAAASNIDFYINEPGMYLQFKEELVINGPTTGDLTFANANPDTITRASGSWVSDGVEVGDIIGIEGSLSNDGYFTIANVSALALTLVSTDTLTAEVASGGLADGVTVIRTFKRTVNSSIYAFRWRLFGNDSTLINSYQFIQHQLRQSSDIDWGAGSSRGDVTNLLMQFATPNGTTLDLYIDDLSAVDINNVTWTDATSNTRLEPFVSAGSISFNANLQNDAAAEYTMFFTNDDAGDNLGRDYGTPIAIIVQDDDGIDISGNVSGASSVSFTYDYDGNVQRGAASAGVDAPVTVVAIGLETAQFVLATSTIQRTKTNNISLVASLERNYSNP